MFEFIIGILTPMADSFSDGYKKNKRYKSIEMPKYLIGRYLSAIVWTLVSFYTCYYFIYNSWLMNPDFYARFNGYSIALTYSIKVVASSIAPLFGVYLIVRNVEDLKVRFGKRKEFIVYVIYYILLHIAIGTLFVTSIFTDEPINYIWLHNKLAGDTVLLTTTLSFIFLAVAGIKYFLAKDKIKN